MKKTIDGKQYDSDKCEPLCKFERTRGGICAGTAYLLRSSCGEYLILTIANGQSIHVVDDLIHLDDIYESPQEFIKNCDLSDKEKERLVELGLSNDD